ncbi:MAG: PD-(D/E)XK nuclease family protein [Vicinamibacteria bacterium]
MERLYSISQIQAYLGCSLKYRFQYIDRIPRPWRPAALVFGSSVHAAIEWFHKERLVGAKPGVEDVLKIFDADWFAQTLEPVVFQGDETKDDLAVKGRGMLQLYAESEHPGEAVAVEEWFELDLSDPETGELLNVRLRGIIDLIEMGDTVVELKTAARALPTGDLERHLQLSTYALVYLLLHQVVPKLRVDMLLKTKTSRLERFTTSRTPADLAWTARLIERTARAIEANHFYPNPSWRCTECEYFAHCQRWRGSL